MEDASTPPPTPRSQQEAMRDDFPSLQAASQLSAKHKGKRKDAGTPSKSTPSSLHGERSRGKAPYSTTARKNTGKQPRPSLFQPQTSAPAMEVEPPQPTPEAPEAEIDQYGTNATPDDLREAAEADTLLREAMQQARWQVHQKAQMTATHFPSQRDANTTESRETPHEKTTRKHEENPFPPTTHEREPTTTRRSMVLATMCALCTLAAKPLQRLDRSTHTELGGPTREGTTSPPPRGPPMPMPHSYTPPTVHVSAFTAALCALDGKASRLLHAPLTP